MHLPRISFLLVLFSSRLNARPSGPVSTTVLGPKQPGPGDSLTDDDQCSVYATCGSKGRSYWQQLLTTIQTANSVDKWPDGTQIFQTYYGEPPVGWEGDGEDVADDLLNNGLPPLDTFTTIPCSSRKGPNGPLDQRKAYENLFNTEAGAIIASWNYRDSDSQKKLPWSEIIYQQYLSAMAPRQSITALQAVIRTGVVNQGTLEVLRTMYAAIGVSLFADNEQWRKWTLTDQPYFFYVLLGTDNVKGVMYLLNDHANALGRKIITAMYTRCAPWCSIWISIGPYASTS